MDSDDEKLMKDAVKAAFVEFGTHTLNEASMRRIVCAVIPVVKKQFAQDWNQTHVTIDTLAKALDAARKDERELFAQRIYSSAARTGNGWAPAVAFRQDLMDWLRLEFRERGIEVKS